MFRVDSQPEEAATGRVGNNEDGEQQQQLLLSPWFAQHKNRLQKTEISVRLVA
jgi:hypothetical protein